MRGLNEKSYGMLLTEYLPRVITTEREHKRALKAIEGLMVKSSRTREEEALYKLLVQLVSLYEDEHHPIHEAQPHEVLSHLMKERGVRQRDLEGMIASKGVISEIVRGKRAISKAQAKRLGLFFGVSPAVFI